MLQPDSTAVTYARPAVPLNSAVPSCTSIAEIVNSISCAFVCGTAAPSFHVADVAAGKRHLSSFTDVSGLGGSAPCAKANARTMSNDEAVMVPYIIPCVHEAPLRFSRSVRRVLAGQRRSGAGRHAPGAAVS